MAYPVRQQATYWGIAAAVFFALLWLLGDVIMPFLLGGAIAYFLDPVADRLERMGLSRAAATTVIALFAVVLFIVAVLLIVPMLARQTSALIETAPELFRRLQAFLTLHFPSLMDEGSTLRTSLASLGQTVQERGAELVTGIVSTFSSVLNVVVLVVIVPVVAFYQLLDWDRMVAEIDRLLPRDHAPVLRELARDIDRTLAGFVRGQGTVCLILGSYYAVALMAIGLQFGLVIGLIAGLLTFIPYVGAIIGALLSVGLALFQFWGEWWTILGVAAIFQVGQLIEGNVLTPKLVGGSVGLHPVWLIFALSAFGTLFGFVGMLVAVPVAAVLGVLARFALREYRAGRLYQGLSGHPPEGGAD